MRKLAAEYIRDHKDDFLPFLTNEDGDPVAEFGFEEYLGKVSRPSTDGVRGEARLKYVSSTLPLASFTLINLGRPLQLRAISSALERRIEVVQPDGRSHYFGEQYGKKQLIITFHRFAYTLGEHYNSVVYSSDKSV